MQPQAVHLTAFKIADKALDGSAVQALTQRVRRHAGEPGRHQVHLDFRHVEIVTASGLGQLLVLHQHLRALDGRLTLANVGMMLYEVFEVTHLTRVLHVRPSRWGPPDA